MSDMAAADVVRQMMAAVARERAKGEPRALAVIQGHGRLTCVPGDRMAPDAASKRWMDLDVKVETFIRDVEDHGLAE